MLPYASDKMREAFYDLEGARTKAITAKRHLTNVISSEHLASKFGDLIADFSKKRNIYQY